MLTKKRTSCWRINIMIPPWVECLEVNITPFLGVSSPFIRKLWLFFMAKIAKMLKEFVAIVENFSPARCTFRYLLQKSMVMIPQIIFVWIFKYCELHSGHNPMNLFSWTLVCPTHKFYGKYATFARVRRESDRVIGLVSLLLDFWWIRRTVCQSL